MYKKIIIACMSSLTSLCSATSIEIIPFTQFDLPDSIKSVQIKKNDEMKKNGYISMPLQFQDAKELIDTRHNEEKILNYRYKSNPYDSHMKKNLKDIKLNFDFKITNIIPSSQIIGYAPAGTYLNGWTGIKAFFEVPDIGVCSYEVVTIDHIKLNKDVVSFSIHQHPTMSQVEGNTQNGFLYHVGWYTETDKKVISHEMACANLLFDSKHIKKMLALANEMDAI